jgi:hypothetical protein
MGDAIMSFTSHVKGKNAKVETHADRIEWAQTGLGRKGSEVIPIRAISSVTTKKESMLWWSVSVITSGNTIDFRADKKKAEEVRQVLTDLMLGKHPQQTPATLPSPPMAPPVAAPVASAGNVTDELAKLVAMHEAGHLTAEEFAAQKTLRDLCCSARYYCVRNGRCRGRRPGGV